ncbi:hypothetical protein BJV74DRAFT_982906 [Russula compacta]|nr:hypothetical protein BJV74DRAFT_982906 [Russula compacta]
MTTMEITPIWIMMINSNFELEGHPFVLKMPSNDPVAYILEEAWKRFPVLMRNADYDQLTVWKINNPVRQPSKRYNTRSSSSTMHHTHPGTDETIETLLGNIRRSSDISQYAELLEGMEMITDYFKQDPEHRIQAIVLFTSRERKPEPSSDVSSGVESLHDPGVDAIKEVTALSPPSDCLGVAGRELRQKIYIGRPEGRFGYPNAIFHRHLGKLHYNLERLHGPNYLDSEELSATEMKFLDVSRNFLRNALNDYENEEARWSSSRQFFTRVFGSPGHEQKGIPKSDFDDKVVGVPDVVWGTMRDKGDRRILPHVILEVKKEKGCGEPTMQCVKYYARCCHLWLDTKFFRSTLFPVILIGLNGHSLEISTVLTLERIVVNQLLILDLKDGFDRNNIIRKLVRISSALAECASLLEQEYKQVMQQGSSIDRCRPCFPQPTLDPRSPSSSSLPVLTYKKRLNDRNESFQIRDNPSPQDLRSLFVAKLDLDGSIKQPDVVVKFTSSYNEEAHKLLAEHNLAPKLYGCHRVIGNLFMVVMERMKGKNMKAHELTEEPLKATVFEDITEAVKLLQEHDFVHGDLRL